MKQAGAARLQNVGEKRVANPGQPTISLGASGEAVKRLERALRRTPNPGLAVDDVFGPHLEAAVNQFQ
jgi:peptidoglycan hydrolase-like protein with peptidoglycan-binding domain